MGKSRARNICELYIIYSIINWDFNERIKSKQKHEDQQPAVNDQPWDLGAPDFQEYATYRLKPTDPHTPTVCLAIWYRNQQKIESNSVFVPLYHLFAGYLSIFFHLFGNSLCSFVHRTIEVCQVWPAWCWSQTVTTLWTPEDAAPGTCQVGGFVTPTTWAFWQWQTNGCTLW